MDTGRRRDSNRRPRCHGGPCRDVSGAVHRPGGRHRGGTRRIEPALAQRDAEKYIELAKLSQQAFEERRRFEWRLVFSIWMALGLIAYTAVTQDVFVPPEALWALSGVLFVAFALYLNAVRRAHRIDKDWKHYYLDRAEDKETKRPKKESLSWLEWIAPQILMMLVVLLLFVYAMSSVKPESPATEGKPQPEKTGDAK